MSSDKLYTNLSNLVTFYMGERPSADKFNAVNKYFSRGLTELAEAVGDLRDGGYPHLNMDGLSCQWNAHSNGLKSRPLDIVNLARLIGPASNLNSRMFTNAFEDEETILETIPAGVSAYECSYYISGTVSIQNWIEKTGHFGNLDEFRVLHNRIITFNKELAAPLTVSYKTKPSEYYGGVDYLYGGFNVIPDPNQSGGVNITVDGNKYLITFPIITHQQSGLHDLDALKDTSINTAMEFNNQVKYELPKWLTERMEALNDEEKIIPKNFIYLKDINSKEVFTDAVYEYVSPRKLLVSNIELCLDDSGSTVDGEYCIVTVGTDITTSIDDLRVKWFKHSHDGSFGEPLVSVKSLGDKFTNTPPSGIYGPSTEEWNFMPMYLHRDGFRPELAGTSNLNNGLNAMRGDLLMGVSSFHPISSATITNNTEGSHKLLLGSLLTRIWRDSNELNITNLAGKIKIDSYDDIKIESYDSDVIIHANKTIANSAIDNAGDGKVLIEAESMIQETSYGIYDDYTYTEKIRYKKDNTTYLNQEYQYLSKNDLDTTGVPNDTGITWSGTLVGSINKDEYFATKADCSLNVNKPFATIYNFEPKFTNALVNSPTALGHSIRPEISKVLENDIPMKWLTYDATITRDNEASVTCSYVDYVEENIREFILPIKEKFFELNYVQNKTFPKETLTNLPWSQSNNTDSAYPMEGQSNDVSFGELQLHDALNTPVYTVAENIHNERNEWSNQIGKIRIVKFFGSNDSDNGKRRSYNIVNINNVFKDGSFDQGWTNVINDSDNLIKLKQPKDIEGDAFDPTRVFYEAVIFRKVRHLDDSLLNVSNVSVFGNDTDDAVFANAKCFKKDNGIIDMGYGSFNDRKNEILIEAGSASSDMYRINYQIAGLINENFAIKVINKSSNTVYYLPGYFAKNEDFTGNDNQTDHPYYIGQLQGKSYTVVGNTIRFHIFPNHIGLSNVNAFDIDDFDFYLLHSFNKETDTHQTMDSYFLIGDASGGGYHNYHNFQTNNNCYFNETKDISIKNDLTQKHYKHYDKVIKWGHYKSWINYEWIENDPTNDSFGNNFLKELKENHDGFYNYFCNSNEYIIDDNTQNNRSDITRWGDIGTNSQYLRIIRKDLVIGQHVGEEYTSRFRINCNKNGDKNLDILKFEFAGIKNDPNYVFNFKSLNKLKFISMPNFILEYVANTSNEVRVKDKSEFFFNNDQLDIAGDSTYLNHSNGHNINITINNEWVGYQTKSNVNLSLYLQKYIVNNFQNLFLPKIDFHENDSISNSSILNYHYNNAITYRHNDAAAINDDIFNTNGNSIKNINSRVLNINGDWRTISAGDLTTNSSYIESIVKGIFGVNFVLDIEETVTRTKEVNLNISFKITNLNVIDLTV